MPLITFNAKAIRGISMAAHPMGANYSFTSFWL